ncbi:MAG: fatty acid hydroxylase family protein [Nostocales cyanobacterium]|nr:MAG: fatty acid hydroxylase family protein [Nostocales cyanobacterium]
MTIMESIFKNFLYPLKQLVVPDSQIYWMYLLSSLLIALSIYLIQFTKTEEKKNFLEYCFPKEVYLHQSAILDYQNYLPMMLLKSFLISPITTILSATVIAGIVSNFLSYLTGRTAIFAITEPQLWHHFAFSIFLILAIDFGYFYNHYLRHKIPLLWEFHKIHHTAEVLTPFTLFRHHPLDYFVQIITVSIFSGVAIGLWTYLFGNQNQILYINGVPFLLFAFYLTGNFRHSHIWLAFPYGISHVFISPAQHYIHHANESKYYDANYGKIFAVWDWIFGTLYVPRNYEKLDLGLPGDEGKTFDSVFNFYWQPFKAVFEQSKNKNFSSVELLNEDHLSNKQM